MKEIYKKYISKLKDFFSLFREKHRLVVMDSDTFQERWSFKLSGMNIFVSVGILSIVLIIVTSVIIAFTPLRQYIPGYMRDDLVIEAHQNRRQLDSLQHLFNEQNLMLENIKLVISGREIPSIDFKPNNDDTVNTVSQDVSYTHSKEDSILRKEVENRDRYQVPVESTEIKETSKDNSKKGLVNYFFFTPLRGTIVSGFDIKTKHYGVDIASKPNEAVKSVYDGCVIFADWTVEGGYVLVIQHTQNIISVYKHNSALLKKVSDVVRAGEPIAFVGNSGELTSGQHLHFELWFNGNPVNPKEYISF